MKQLITIERTVLFMLAGLVALTLCGYPQAYVTPTKTAGGLRKPDMIVVHDFAVTSAEVKLDPSCPCRVV